MKRTPLKATTTGLRRTPLNRGTATLDRKRRLAPVSERRRVEAEAWRALKAYVWERDGGRCRVAEVWPEVECSGRVDVHHTWPTGQGWPRLADPETLISACRRHHRLVHSETRLARERGVLH